MGLHRVQGYTIHTWRYVGDEKIDQESRVQNDNGRQIGVDRRGCDAN